MRTAKPTFQNIYDSFDNNYFNEKKNRISKKFELIWIELVNKKYNSATITEFIKANKIQNFIISKASIPK